MLLIQCSHESSLVFSSCPVTAKSLFEIYAGPDLIFKKSQVPEKKPEFQNQVFNKPSWQFCTLVSMIP